MREEEVCHLQQGGLRGVLGEGEHLPDRVQEVQGGGEEGHLSGGIRPDPYTPGLLSI